MPSKPSRTKSKGRTTKSINTTTNITDTTTASTLHFNATYLFYATSVLISFLAMFTFWETRRAGFVWDDRAAIQGNRDVTSNQSLFNVFKNDFWGLAINTTDSHKSYRPLCVLTFRLNYMYSNLDASSYHVVNVVLHGLVTCLVYYLTYVLLSIFGVGTLDVEDGEHGALKKFLRKKAAQGDKDAVTALDVLDEIQEYERVQTTPEVVDANMISSSTCAKPRTLYYSKEIQKIGSASMASLLFAIHPVHVEAVAGLVSRADIMAAFFMILAILSYLKSWNIQPKNQHKNQQQKNYQENYQENQEKQNQKQKEQKNISKKNTTSSYQIYMWTLTSCVLVIAASLSKETGATVLAVLLFMECIQPKHRPKNAPSSFINSAAISFVRVCFVLGTGVFYALLRKVIQGEASLRQWSMMENHIQMAKVSQKISFYSFHPA